MGRYGAVKRASILWPIANLRLQLGADTTRGQTPYLDPLSLSLSQLVANESLRQVRTLSRGCDSTRRRDPLHGLAIEHNV